MRKTCLQRFFLLAIALLTGAEAQAETPTYRITIIEAPGESRTWSPSAIDSTGRVVGITQSITQVPNSTPVYGFIESFLWQAGAGVVVLPLPTGSTGVYARDVADSGQVVGNYIFTQPNGSNVGRAFSWTPGTGLVTLDDGGAGYAGKVNSVGQITGSRLVGSNSRAVIWQGASTTILEGLDPSDTSSVATSINDAGTVVGYAIGSAGFQPLKWVNGNPTPLLGLEGSEFTIPVDINNSGQIVGHSDFGFMTSAPVNWTPDAVNGTRMFPRLGSYSAQAVNDVGQSVGFDANPSSDPEFFSAHDPFLWSESTGVVWLANQIDPSDPLASIVRLNTVLDINDRGQIVGTAFVGGVDKAVLLTPVPEPSSVWLLSLGAGILLMTVHSNQRTATRSNR